MTVFRFKNLGLLLLFLLVFVTFSCSKKPVAVQPPPPPPPPVVPPPAPTITLRANPATVERGQPVTLAWQAQNAATVQIDPGIGAVMATGNRMVNPASSVTYTAKATGPGGEATDIARVTVNVPPPPPPVERPAPKPPDVSIDELLRQRVQDVLFDYDKSDIRPSEVAKLQASAAFFKEHSEVRVTIDGNADERGSQEYNLGLGDRRANTVKEFLVMQGVNANRMMTVSYGEERPVCREQTEDCYQKNRRAGFTRNP
jgi:peptidoglycan-associated lipoprotein